MTDTPTPTVSRAERLAEVSRKWHDWALNAMTDTPPDVYAGDPLPDGTVAETNVWELDGRYVDEQTWADATRPPLPY